MKICVLTQPLSANYGGLLQTYALQTILKRMGHEVWTEDRKPNKLTHKLKRSTFIRKLLGKAPLVLPTEEDLKVITCNTQSFIQKYITTTVPVTSTHKRVLKQYSFEGYVVGSDQVWRPCYSYGLGNYFLDFTKGEKVKRVAYAASFGVDEWEFTSGQTKQCKKLATLFDGISVREASGVKLCRDFLDVEATHVLDPTMLLEKDDYIKLIEQEKIPYSGGNLMVYVLDQTTEKRLIVEKIIIELALTPISIMPKSNFDGLNHLNIKDYIFPPVLSWIRGFIDAEFVVTDSFHGTVFAILFNKPFISICNKERGMSRFESLLSKFGLKNRLIFSVNQLTSDIIHEKINFDNVNKEMKNERQFSLEWLLANLNK